MHLAMRSKIAIVTTLILLIMFVVSCKQKKADETNLPDIVQSKGIILNKAQMQLANIKVETIKTSEIGKEIIFSGKLVVNENTTKIISTKVSGRIDKLFFKASGNLVNKGEMLYEIYSEDLISAQKEYLLAIEKQKKLGSTKNDITSFIESAKNRLLQYGLTETQIDQIEISRKVRSTIAISSPVSGYVRELKINEGDYEMQGSAIFELSDYSSLWIEAQAYPDEMEFVREQAPVTYVVTAFPNDELKGTISFINPEIEQKSQINLIRVEIANSSKKYKPGMMAEVKLETNLKSALTLPSNALIVDAKGSSVWVQDSAGTFNIRMVTVGIRNPDRVEITSGIKENEKVVISGAYLLNSEYILKNGSDPMAGMKM